MVENRSFAWARWVAVVALGGVLTAGCAALVPASTFLTTPGDRTPPLQVHDETTVNLNSDNFVLIKTNVIGTSKGFSLFGIIVMYPATLNKAMGRMYAAAAMPSGRPQTVSHLIIETSSTYWVLFGIPKIQVWGDVVEFVPKKQTQVVPIKPAAEPSGH